MGTHLIPREVEGEGRILIIFSVQGLIGTVIGGVIGILFYKLCAALGAPIVGWVLIALFGLIGFIIGQVKIPDTNAMPLFKKTGGEAIWKIIIRYFNFKKNKKIYVNDVVEKTDVVEESTNEK